MTMPTANQIAWAIVEACRATGEDPIVVAEVRKPQSRARHYAFQALVATFPMSNKIALAYRCGCSGKPEYYAVNSSNGMHRYVGGPHAGERKHRFWDEGIFARVINAVRVAEVEAEAVSSDEDVVPAPTPSPIKLGPDCGRLVEPARSFISERQAKAYRMLQEAVANTAKIANREG